MLAALPIASCVGSEINAPAYHRRTHIVEVLEYLHSSGFVGRDPNDVLLSINFKFGLLLLCDFDQSGGVCANLVRYYHTFE